MGLQQLVRSICSLLNLYTITHLYPLLQILQPKLVELFMDLCSPHVSIKAFFAWDTFEIQAS